MASCDQCRDGGTTQRPDDAVLSHRVVDNLPTEADRRRALSEILRVLRPGGALVFADIAHHAESWSHFAARGLADIRVHTGGLPSRIVGVLTGGSFRPQSLVGRCL